MVTTVITGEVGDIKGGIQVTTVSITTTIISTTTVTVVNIKDAAVEETKECIKEEGVKIEHLKMGAKSVEDNNVIPTATVTIPVVTSII